MAGARYVMFPVIIICKSEPQTEESPEWLINNYFNSHPVFVSMRDAPLNKQERALIHLSYSIFELSWKTY